MRWQQMLAPKWREMGSLFNLNRTPQLPWTWERDLLLADETGFPGRCC